MKVALSLAVALASLSACSRDTTRYPSLAPRAVEKLGFAEPEVPVVEAKPDPALDAKIAEFGVKLDRLAKGFAGDAAKADAAAAKAKGKAVGSDAWLDAQTALAQLDDWRAQTSSLLSDIDVIAADRAAKLAPAYPALGAVRERIAAEAAKQAATIDRVQASLPAA